MKRVPFRIFSSMDLFTFSNRVADIVAELLADNPYILLIVAQIRTGTSNLAQALGKALKSEFTPLLLEKDEMRDDRFKALYNYIKAYLKNLDSVKAAAALSLINIIDEIGHTLYSLGYMAETSKLEQLFKRFDTPEATQWLQAISATDWYADLKTAQADFETYYQLKVSTEGDIDTPLTKDAKIMITLNMRSLLNYVASNIQFEAVKYTPVQDKINEIITSAVAVARARATREAKQSSTSSASN